MTYTYQLDENDYLHYLFYSTTKSKKVQKRRAMNKLLLMIMYVATGIFLFNRNGPIASAVFFVLCLPLYFLYNSFEKKQYNRHFGKFINLHFKERIGKPASISFEENGIHLVDEEENRFRFDEIEWISETGSIVIIQLKAGNAFIIPKNKLNSPEEFMQTLHDKSIEAGITYNKELSWKWK